MGIGWFISQFFGDVKNLALSVLLLPLMSFLILFLFAEKLPRKGDLIASLLSGLAFLFSAILLVEVWRVEILRLGLPWFVIPGANGSETFTVSLLINDMSAVMLTLVTFISFLVHLYSIEYMKGKKHYVRYFPYLGLFTFSMLGIVLSDNLLITFMFWEMVGFSSYLLIGFWYEKEEAMRAAKKAFLFNRIGDTGFVVALLIIYSLFGSFEISDISVVLRGGQADPSLVFWTGLGLFIGCLGKSAQFPLQAWLPDAMEGPTPVSALIHAATMVAAGIYLLIKVYFLLDSEVLLIVTLVGAVTAFMGAVPALFQTDIKKVLAFSTISQLGFMMMAIGVRVPMASFFHLITHGFFKACLFLGAGAVIHGMHHIKHDLFVRGQYRDFDSQDMRLMGGFARVMPVTFISFAVGAAALIGLPLFSGFLSKDAILEGAIQWAGKEGGIYYAVPVLAFASVFLTAFYMTRQICMIFPGRNRLTGFYPHSNEVFETLHDPSLLMKGPLILLALLSLWFFYSWSPLTAHPGHMFEVSSGLPAEIISSVLSLLGIALGWYQYRYRPVRVAFMDHVEERKGLVAMLKNNWNLDKGFYMGLVKPGFFTAKVAARTDSALIDGFIHFTGVFTVTAAHVIAWLDRALVDGIVNLTAKIAGKAGKILRGWQGGKLQKYFLLALLMVFALFIWIIIKE